MIDSRQLGGVQVSAIGLGCVGMSAEYGSTADWDPAAALTTLDRAIELGITLFDTADSYGPFTNEELLGALVQRRPASFSVATKTGLVLNRDTDRFEINGRPERIRAACEDSLRRLHLDSIDLYYLHRVDPAVPLEETWGALAELRDQGKVRALGLCEATVDQLEAVHAIAPLSAVQSEFSLWTREPLSNVIPWCAANNVGFVPYAPLGRGFLTGTITSAAFDDGDIRAENPRFSNQAISSNQAIIEGIRSVAEHHQATPAQVAIAWILAQGDFIVPIPGTKRIKYLEENVAAVSLSLRQADLATLATLPQPVGERY